jgi:hypothetical protein
MSPEEELLKRLYERFNARDLESALLRISLCDLCVLLV